MATPPKNPEIRRVRARIAGLTAAKSPAVQYARRDLDVLLLQERIRTVVESPIAPTPEQLADLRALLGGAR